MGPLKVSPRFPANWFEGEPMLISGRTGIFVFILVQAFAASGCGGHHQSSPLAPTTTAPGATPATASAAIPAPANVGSVGGFVLDTAFRPLAGAGVEVLTGVDASLSTTANAEGHFFLAGRFDATTVFRAFVNGHDSVTETPRFSSPGGQPWIIFWLEPLGGAVNIAGDYTLTLTADDACVGLPDEVRTRSYTATVALTPVAHIPKDTHFSVTVHGTASGPQSFPSIGVAGQDLGFDSSDNDDGIPMLVEQVGPDAYLRYRPYNGLAGTRVDETVPAISTSFDGTIEYSAAATHLQCQSAHHRLLMTRR